MSGLEDDLAAVFCRVGLLGGVSLRIQPVLALGPVGLKCGGLLAFRPIYAFALNLTALGRSSGGQNWSYA